MDASLALSLGQPSTPLPNQVAGHQGVMSDASGSLVIKPSLAREIAFYQLINESPRSSPFTQLKPFIPKFFGTLRLEGRLEGNGQLKDDITEKAEVPESVVLQNLSHGFTRPSILDAKLGTVLHEPDAPKEKQERMEKQAKETTTRETGLRLTGCQVCTPKCCADKTWHVPTQSYILTPKSFGKGIKASQLPSGMVRYFPLPTDNISSLVTPPSPAPTTSASSTFGSAQLAPPAQSASSSAESAAPPHVPLTPLTGNAETKEYASHAIPPNLLIRVLDIIDSELAKLETLLSSLEMRFVGASVLVVYEGDPDRLAAALERYDSKPPKFVSDDKEGSDDGMDLLSDEETDSEDGDSDDMDGLKAEEKERRRCPPVVLKLIDFAHTWLADGEGPDQGVLLGIRTLRVLVAGRRAAVEQATRSSI